ncbi:MAG TPA: ABC transporter ATP-binding protein [Solirubrobacteraceae bacterium]|nr:ABC transporter ATP-binding protein [Solirubrobacteraceae bacterium]
MSALLAAEEIGMRFGAITALDDVSLKVDPGEIVAVVGPNGAGKTTLLSIISGLIKPSAGRLVPPVPEVGWAPQQQSLYKALTARENLELFAHLESVPDADAAVERMLEQTGLASRADERAGNLSGGNRQRVNVALALLGEPPLLALDEPTAALDPAQRERLWRFVAELAHGGTAVLFVSHNIGEVQRWATRVVVLDRGHKLFDGPVEELAAGGELEQGLLALLAGWEEAA